MASSQFTPNAGDLIIDPKTGQFTEIGRILVRTLTQAVSGFAPTTAQYWTSTSDAGLSNERNLGALASGYLKILSAAGIAVPSSVAAIPMMDIAGLATALAAYRPIAPRVTALTSNATPTPNADTTDLYSLTAQAAGAAFVNPTGTPGNGQTLQIRLKDDGTARGLTWGTAYVAGGVALPSTTVLSKILNLFFTFNTDNGLNRWQLYLSAQEA